MKKCKQCETNNSDEFKFCMKCGAPLDDEAPQTQETVQTEPNVQETIQNDSSSSKQGLAKKFIIIGAAVLTLAAIVTVVVVLLGKGSSKGGTFGFSSNTPTIYSKDGIVHAIYDGKNTGSREMSISDFQYPLNHDAIVIFETDGETLYFYNGGTIDLISIGVNDYRLSYDGSKIAYSCEDGLFVYDTKSTNIKQISYFSDPSFAISPNGKYVAYTNSYQELCLFDGKNDDIIVDFMNVQAVAAVNNNKEIFFIEGDSALLMTNKKGKITRITDVASEIHFNRDNTECAVIDSENVAIYRDGSVNKFEQEDIGGIDGLLFPSEMNYIYIDAGIVDVYLNDLDTFINKYYWTVDDSIVMVDKYYDTIPIADELTIDDAIISNDGKVIYYQSGKWLYKYDGKDTICVSENVQTLYECDLNGDGVYYLSNDNVLSYVGKSKEIIPLGEYTPYADVVNFENYYIFMERIKGDVYSSKQGSELALVREMVDGDSISYFLGYGLSYFSINDELYYIKNKSELRKVDLIDPAVTK